MSKKAETNKSTNRVPKREEETKWKYPHNQVIVWPGGHELHIDNTPGKERVRFAHKSGTYTEIYANGDRTDFVVGNQQIANKSGVTLTIEKNGDINIGGSSRVVVGGGSHVEVAGDAGILIGGDAAIITGGNMNMSVDNAYLGVRGNLNMNIAGDSNIQTTGNMTMKTGGTSTITSKGTMDLATDSSFTQTAQGTSKLKGSTLHLNDPGHGSGADTTIGVV